MQNKSMASAAVILAGAFWGMISIFVRKLSEAGLSSMEIVCIRMALASLGLFSYLLMKKPFCLRICLRDLWMFAVIGIVSITLHNCCYFYAMQIGNVSVVVVLEYTSPIFVMLMSALLFREKITRKKLIALGMVVLGCINISGLLRGKVTVSLSVLLLGIAGGFLYATYSVFGTFAAKRYDAMTVAFYSFLFAAISTAPFLRFSAVVDIFYAKPTLLLWSLGLGVFCTILPYILYTVGLKDLESGRAAILAATDPLVGALIGFLIFQEPVCIERIAGVLLILAAVLLLNIHGDAVWKRHKHS